MNRDPSVVASIAAGTETWSVFDEHLDHHGDGSPEDARLVKDHPWLLEIAGDCAADAGESDRAGRAWQLSRDLWDRLDDAESTERVDEKFAGVDT